MPRLLVVAHRLSWAAEEKRDADRETREFAVIRYLVVIREWP